MAKPLTFGPPRPTPKADRAIEFLFGANLKPAKPKVKPRPKKPGAGGGS